PVRRPPSARLPRSLHDPLPISPFSRSHRGFARPPHPCAFAPGRPERKRSCLLGQKWIELALPVERRHVVIAPDMGRADENLRHRDRTSTRLNSSHVSISYAVVC